MISYTDIPREPWGTNKEIHWSFEIMVFWPAWLPMLSAFRESSFLFPCIYGGKVDLVCQLVLKMSGRLACRPQERCSSHFLFFPCVDFNVCTCKPSVMSHGASRSRAPKLSIRKCGWIVLNKVATLPTSSCQSPCQESPYFFPRWIWWEISW